MAKVLLIGSTGFLGSNFASVFNIAHELVCPSREELNMESEVSILNYFEFNTGFELVINCSGYNFVDKAEESEVEAQRCLNLNGVMPGVLAKVLADKFPNCRLWQFSSDYVFDGEKKAGYQEDAVKNPLSVYGKSKDLGEEAVLMNNPNAAVIRISWLFGSGGRNFVRTIIDNYKRDGIVSVVNDQYGKATYAKDVARFCFKNQNLINTGIYHLPNEGVLSWYDLADVSLSLLENDPKIKPISSSELNRLAKRPKYSILSNKKLPNLRDSKEALAEYINNYLV